jgi:hypothetical protein
MVQDLEQAEAIELIDVSRYSSSRVPFAARLICATAECSAGWKVAMMRPVPVVLFSTSRSANAPPSVTGGVPSRTSGWISRTNSSTRPPHHGAPPLPTQQPCLFLEFGHGLCGVAPQQRGVPPAEGLPKRPRCDVLLAIVQHSGERSLVRLVGPEAGEVLVGASPEQELPAPGPLALRSRHRASRVKCNDLAHFGVLLSENSHLYTTESSNDTKRPGRRI